MAAPSRTAPSSPLMLPQSVQTLINELAKLPGIGRKSAERMALGLVTGPVDSAQALERAIASMRDRVGICPECGYFTEDDLCPACSDPRREEHLLMVVERAMDVVAFEKAGGFPGRYHVLGGHLSPLKGITPKKLNLDSLYQRVRLESLTELILATSPSVEGDATALFIAREVQRAGLSITRLGRGVPMGGSLEFADSGTLRLAVESRRSLDS